MFSENFISLTDYAVKAFESSSFDSYEISCVDRLHALTRFANSTIHQNVSDHTSRFLFKASKRKKICTLSLTSLTKTAINSAVSQLETMLSFIPEIPFFQGFSEDTEEVIPSINATGSLLDEYQRADIVETAIGEAEAVDKSAKLAGAISITDLRYRILNSNGIDISHQITYNGLIINSLTEKEGKGYAKEEQFERDPFLLKPAELSRKATELSVSTCSAKDYSLG
ncbi:MAG: hypothetical protein GPJ50_15385, partial [Candidatus Heimdallarchaeota archaeon]|nr:hypothetical protein [Candidatus Heimdallarchaeota archaeon]